MKVQFLGTASSFPTRERSHTSILLRYGPEAILFDCGEGTQRQLRIAGESPMKITKIFITHWHGDHVLGLPGLLESMAMNNRTDPLEIFGPGGTKESIKYLFQALHIRPNFKLSVHEVDTRTSKLAINTKDYAVQVQFLKHRIPCLAYSFKEKDRYRIDKMWVRKEKVQGLPALAKLQQGQDVTINGKKIKAKDVTYASPGKKLTIIFDTAPFADLAKFAKDSDLLICEGTFSNKLRDKVKDYGHLTVKDAAKIAKSAKASKLVLTHFSQRYKDVSELKKEATSVFKNTTLAKDFMIVNV
ncbi:ribonuclease Z [Candidatus Woesearchaeota archaeon]|jgi:ribonuclease Z|nr:ribonuclease Z [Candidatus Woesearchaeota archaeon]MBT4248199.1 ribonuclease Z [Candidatus Woesearchaeota archaeon]